MDLVAAVSPWQRAANTSRMKCETHLGSLSGRLTWVRCVYIFNRYIAILYQRQGVLYLTLSYTWDVFAHAVSPCFRFLVYYSINAYSPNRITFRVLRVTFGIVYVSLRRRYLRCPYRQF
jgi:hypothetical protein